MQPQERDLRDSAPLPEGSMKASLFLIKGIPLERQKFTWRDLVQKPISKLDDDA